MYIKGMHGKMRPKRTKSGHRSVAEGKFSEVLTSAGIPFEYEPKEKKLPYILHKQYLPDFVLSNGIIVEYKGYFDVEDRKKIIAVREGNCFEDIRFVFSNSKNKLSKTKKRFPITYGDWCENQGIQYLCERRDSQELIIRTIKEWSKEYDA